MADEDIESLRRGFEAFSRGSESGIPLDVQLANVFTIKGGVAVEWYAYTSKALALQALGVEDEL